MAIKIEPLTIPVAGKDRVKITIEETYDIDGIGKDTVVLTGYLVTNRGAPLLDHGTKAVDWTTSTVVAQFTSLNVSGKSDLFGPVRVTLDKSVPAFGVVRAGKCVAALGIQVDLPQHGLTLRSSEPVQLHSTVKTVPPIGDEKTESVLPVNLINVRSNKPMGKIKQVKVMWRELVTQTAHKI